MDSIELKHDNEIRLAELNGGQTTIAHNSFFSIVPVGYAPGTSIMWNGTILYEAASTIRDKDMKVFLAILKAYADGRYEALKNVVSKNDIALGVPSEPSFVQFKVNVREICDAAFNNQRARPGWLLDAMKNMMDLKMHLLDSSGGSTGFITVVPGVILTQDRKELKIAIDKHFLKDMMQNLSTYHFPTMMAYKGRAFRLNMVMQSHKYCTNPKTKDQAKRKYAYQHYVPHDTLKAALNIHSEKAVTLIAGSFKELGLNYAYNKKRNMWVKGKGKNV